MELTKKQVESVLSKFASEENGLHTVLELVMNSLMLSERSVHFAESTNNKGNGYRNASVFGHGHQLELRIPRCHHILGINLVIIKRGQYFDYIGGDNAQKGCVI